jgi:hypothetical protein
VAARKGAFLCFVRIFPPNDAHIIVESRTKSVVMR